MNISLSKFCKDRGLPKSSVYARCKELGIDTSNGLNEAAIAQLEHEFDCVAATPEAAPAPSDIDSQLSALMTVEHKPLNGNALEIIGYQDVNTLSTSDLMALARSRRQDNAHIHQVLSERIELNERETKALKYERIGLEASNEELEETLIRAQVKLGSQSEAINSEKAKLLDELQRQQQLGK